MLLMIFLIDWIGEFVIVIVIFEKLVKVGYWFKFEIIRIRNSNFILFFLIFLNNIF